MFADETDREVIALLVEDDDLLAMAMDAYKARWGVLRSGAVGSAPCLSTEAMTRVARKADEKLLVLCGWHDPQGGSNGFCAYCGIPISVHEMTVDHLVPRSLGGTEELSNLVPACPECNRLKSNDSAASYLAREGLDAKQIGEWKSETDEAIRFRRSQGNVWMMRLSPSQLDRLGITAN